MIFFQLIAQIISFFFFNLSPFVFVFFLQSTQYNTNARCARKVTTDALGYRLFRQPYLWILSKLIILCLNPRSAASIIHYYVAPHVPLKCSLFWVACLAWSTRYRIDKSPLLCCLLLKCLSRTWGPPGHASHPCCHAVPATPSPNH